MRVKNILLSKTVWGAAIAFVAALFPHVFQSIAAVLGVTDPTILAAQVVGAMGAILAIYGRVTAKSTITVLPR